MAEILSESYREIRDGGHEKVERVIQRLQKTVKYLIRGKGVREFTGGSKEKMMFIEELPFLLDMTLHRLLESSKNNEKDNDDEKDIF